MALEQFNATLTLDHDFRFEVDLAQQPESIRFAVDETPPLGEGAGPNPARLLATAVGHCLGASLLFCLRKARVPVDGLRVVVEGSYTRNDRGRLRIGGLAVRLEPELSLEARARAARCLEVFEDYCIVTESVRSGIPVTVETVPKEVDGAVPVP